MQKYSNGSTHFISHGTMPFSQINFLSIEFVYMDMYQNFSDERQKRLEPTTYASMLNA